MKKKFFITLAALFSLTNMLCVYGDNDSVTVISQVEIINYVLYAGAVLFLLGMVFILLALFLKQPKDTDIFEDESELLNYDEDLSADSIASDGNIDDLPEDNNINTENAEIESETTEDDLSTLAPNDEQMQSESEFSDESEPINTDNKSEDTQGENITPGSDEAAEAEPELPTYRITFTGTNNPDLKILEFSGSATVGRKAMNNLMIADNAVSGVHCKIYSEDDKIYIEDMASTNGTILNGTAITKEELKSDDILVLGKKQYKVSIS